MESIGSKLLLRFLVIFAVAIFAGISTADGAEDQFECKFDIDNEQDDIVGQFINFSCTNLNRTTQNGLNESSVAWYRLETSGEAELVEFDQWFVSKWDNGVTFVCAEETIQGLDVLCEVTPLNISPTVQVERSILGSEDTAIFVCIGEGIPDILKYKWFINGNDTSIYNPVYLPLGESDDRANGDGQRGIRMYSDSIMEVFGLSDIGRGMVVTCEVETSTGLRASAHLAYSVDGEKLSSGGMTSDKVFLFGLIFAGGVPMIFAVVATACWVVRRDEDNVSRKRSLTVEEEDLSPVVKVDSLPRSVASGVTSDMPANAVLYRSHSVRSTKDKVGPMSQLVLPPIGTESNRVSQHIYDEAPNFATSELALSRGKHSSTLPAKTYTSRSSLYRMSADYADVAAIHTSAGNYENFRLQPSTMNNGNPNATLPAIRL
ncbi:uncharacterized protein [Apostichopus japonicus]